MVAPTFPPLPDYDQPPVIEVVLALQFEPLAQLQVQHVGLLWEIFRGRFPKVETKPPLDAVIEIFEQKPVRPSIKFEVAEFPAFPRVWFVTTAGEELVQIQSDRFIHNWRKRGDASVYPRYERIREDFERELQQFMAFLSEHALGELKPVQCEVTYINHLPAGEGWSTHGEAARILKVLDPGFRLPFLDEPEAIRFSTRYLLRQDTPEAKPFGRIYIELDPAFSAQQKPIFVLNLTARAVPDRPDIEAAMNCYDLGRKHIVCTFDAITTRAMQDIWRRNAS